MTGRHASAFSAAVVAPTFNNAATLERIVTRITRLGLPLIVVNDGSTDDTPALLARLQNDLRISVVTHDANRGKAAALMSGFDAAAALGHTHALTIDTDGQLDPAEIPSLLTAAEVDPLALVIGTRDISAADYPSRSRWGRIASNLFVRWESGLRVSDSQCGFRVYPLKLVRDLGCRAGRYAFETEVLTRAAWAGARVVELPISCTYLTPIERVSHFRPWVDSFRALDMHARLVGDALLDWISPRRAWRELREQKGAPGRMAAGLAIGVFIGNLPFYGVQTILSLYAARRLRLHPLGVVAGSHVSTPPLGPLLVATAIGVGHWLLHGKWLEPPRWESTWSGWARLAGKLMIEWSIGSVLVGSVLAAAAFVVSHAMLRRLQ